MKRNKRMGAVRKPSEPTSRATRRGAVQSRAGLTDRAGAYWAHHRTSAQDSLHRLLSTPLQTLLTALVVAIALALPATLLVALNNIYALGENWDANPKISLYLDLDASETAIANLRERVRARPEVADLVYISPEQAVLQFQELSGFGEALQSLEENPLPPTLVLSPRASAREPAQLQLLASQLRQEPLVADISLDMEWVRRLRDAMLLGKRAVYALASLLALGVLIAVGNTIRLAIENRRDEIVVAKLVGGTDGFVRRPFLYSGGWYGLMGGALACLLVALGDWSLSGPVQRLAASYQSSFQLQGLGLAGSLLLLLLSVLLGWLGSWLAVSRHLNQIEPR